MSHAACLLPPSPPSCPSIQCHDIVTRYPRLYICRTEGQGSFVRYMPQCGGDPAATHRPVPPVSQSSGHTGCVTRVRMRGVVSAIACMWGAARWPTYDTSASVTSAAETQHPELVPPTNYLHRRRRSPRPASLPAAATCPPFPLYTPLQAHQAHARRAIARRCLPCSVLRPSPRACTSGGARTEGGGAGAYSSSCATTRRTRARTSACRVATSRCPCLVVAITRARLDPCECRPLSRAPTQARSRVSARDVCGPVYCVGMPSIDVLQQWGSLACTVPPSTGGYLKPSRGQGANSSKNNETFGITTTVTAMLRRSATRAATRLLAGACGKMRRGAARTLC
jgi:hypothetical protein